MPETWPSKRNIFIGIYTMGKRSNFARQPKDKIDTPVKAVVPLLKHLPPTNFHYLLPLRSLSRLFDNQSPSNIAGPTFIAPVEIISENSLKVKI